MQYIKLYLSGNSASATRAAGHVLTTGSTATAVAVYSSDAVGSLRGICAAAPPAWPENPTAAGVSWFSCESCAKPDDSCLAAFAIPAAALMAAGNRLYAGVAQILSDGTDQPSSMALVGTIQPGAAIKEVS